MIGYIIDITKKGILIVIKGKPKGVWFPKSQIRSKYNKEPHYYQNFEFTRWILKQKKLIREFKDMKVYLND